MTSLNLLSVRYYASLLVLMVVPIVSGWMMNNLREPINTSPLCVSSDEKSFCRYSSSVLPSSTNLFAATVDDEEEDEIIEYLDDDDDDEDDVDTDYDPEGARGKKAEWMDQLQSLAQTALNDPSAVSAAQEIFDDMFTAYAESDDAIFFPTVEVYNLILETHAYSKSPDGGEEAERILGRMEDKSNDFVASPNEETYMCVMDAWAMRERPDKVQEILDRQEAPTTNSYNKLIKAYGIADDLEMAESVFRSLLSEKKANHKSWVQLMKARVSSEDRESDVTVQSLFTEMEEEGFDPQTNAYNVLIRSIGRKSDGTQKAEAMLFDMIERFQKGEERVKPNSDTFRAVLTAYNGRGKKFTAASVSSKVEQIMQIREGLLTQEESSSDERIYRLALGIVGRSKDSKKAVRANRMLQKYDGVSLYLNYLVLKACAYTNGNSQEKFEAFQVALGILKYLRSSPELRIESSITGMFIKACNKLMPASPKRDDIVKKIFQECCTQGLVNDFVLNEFELASSETLQLDVLGGFSVDGVNIPEKWSRNVPP
mmetsp:Transcript_27508/g.60524  ORF Transcript_27508/g.60524 Transcript_27508/m.60524 type:complete len:541 (+) Transcript_27508:254-1876(+)|eukprot:CAMPEP_0168197750 /NCGR_PEP_ID=MMETSP0139_2-20121125/21359_1 /TAXON_ID=44445 /ORGANISM="Pseudo-nitzschia australis, Strain 10249 10 AB" /LENGTH=540 /DNA_ID=CAMNT_0008122299 /DNA_START=222 /DNA_END=1844 /DNA_ORIENTATION=-